MDFTLIHEVTLYIFINHFHFIFIMRVTCKALDMSVRKGRKKEEKNSHKREINFTFAADSHEFIMYIIMWVKRNETLAFLWYERTFYHSKALRCALFYASFFKM